MTPAPTNQARRRAEAAARMTPEQAEAAAVEAMSFGCSRRKARAILAALPSARAAELDAASAHLGGFVEHVAI